MMDELEELARANPTTPQALEPVVAVDRQALVEMLEADSGSRFRPAVFGGRSGARIGYAGAMVAAAAVLLAIGSLGSETQTPDPDVVGSATESAPVMSVIVEDSEGGQPPASDQDRNRTSTTATTEADGPVVSVDGPGRPGEGQAGGASNSETDPKSQQETDTGTGTGTATGADPDPDGGTATTTAGEPPSVAPVIEGPFDRSTDLLSLHFDYAHLDDGHAGVAARELATWFGLDPHVVAGTAAAGSDGYVHQFGTLMAATWGDDWFDADDNRPEAVGRTADRWLAVIDDGGRVWVAEGGVSDFTAEVILELKNRRPGIDTGQAIVVVQHNGRNENQSVAESLRLVMDNTSYVRIDDGNEANDTADLNRPSDRLKRAAETGRHRQSWSVAFGRLPAEQLDFSDTVAVLHILGVGTDEVADPDDFADRFMN